jgi:assimilatory nitrate reductase catalytic subunit/bacterioferritin-associated ferredoxin
MIICHCHAVNDRQIKEAVENGVDTIRGLHRELKVGSTWVVVCHKYGGCWKQP